jgi:hypothetical protein
MARSALKPAAILLAFPSATRRRLGTYRALKVNNFVLIILLIGYGASQSGVEPKSAYPFLLFLFLVLLFPLSGDPLDQAPPSRLALWPLSRRDRLILRIASLALSPILWFVLAMMLFRRIRPGIGMAFITVAIIVQAISAAARFAPAFDLRKLTPRFPGSVGILLRSNLRQLFSSLDFFLALVFTAGGILYRFLAPHPDPAAFPILAILIALNIGDYAQCLFGRDIASSAMVRYRLLPLRGSSILLAKDLAILLVTLILTAPVHWLAGITYGFAALATGHHASLLHPEPLHAWRLSGSRLYIGVIQGIAGIILAFGAAQSGSRYLLAAIALYCLSISVYGWLWDRRAYSRLY